jgi:uncharacterized DUF497 family protein
MARVNQSKHGIEFADAVDVFSDPAALTIEDEEIRRSTSPRPEWMHSIAFLSSSTLGAERIPSMSSRHKGPLGAKNDDTRKSHEG